jgi:hypothetical protein
MAARKRKCMIKKKEALVQGPLFLESIFFTVWVVWA